MAGLRLPQNRNYLSGLILARGRCQCGSWRMSQTAPLTMTIVPITQAAVKITIESIQSVMA
jgi:hypothetical protein